MNDYDDIEFHSDVDSNFEKDLDLDLDKDDKPSNITNEDILNMYNDAMDMLNEFHQVSENINYKKENQINNLPWIEKFRPSKMDDIISQKNNINILKTLITNRIMPHMIFSGSSGTGKTSTIMTCIKELYGPSYNTMTMIINASEERGIDVVRDKIKKFVASKGIFSYNSKLFKMIILDEADSMTINAQLLLSTIIDKYYFNVRFCFICNYIKKIIPSIQSRCVVFRFKPLNNDMIINKVNNIIKDMGINISSDAINTILRIAKGDMRKVLNTLQAAHMIKESNNIIDSNIISLCTNYPSIEHINKIYDMINSKTKSFKKAYKYLIKIISIDSYSINDIVNELFLKIVEEFNSGNIKQKKFITIINNISKFELSQVSNPHIKIQVAGLIGIFRL